MALSWGALGTILSLILPAYGLLAGIMWRLGKLNVSGKDVSENDERIDDIRERQVRLEEQVEILKKRQKVIHDIDREDNHCGASDCPWCEPDELM